MQFQPSQYSNYGGDDYGSIWSGFTYASYRARGYSAEESAIKTFESQKGRKATAAEKAAIAKGWSGDDAQLPADVVEQAIRETQQGPLPAGPPQPAPQTAPVPEEKPKKKKLTEQDWFWPTVIVVGSLGVAGAFLYLPKRD